MTSTSSLGSSPYTVSVLCPGAGSWRGSVFGVKLQLVSSKFSSRVQGKFWCFSSVKVTKLSTITSVAELILKLSEGSSNEMVSRDLLAEQNLTEMPLEVALPLYLSSVKLLPFSQHSVRHFTLNIVELVAPQP